MDVRELLRHIQRIPSDRAVQRATGVHRRTVQRYRAWATTQGLLTGTLPTIDALQQLLESSFVAAPPPQTTSTLEPYRGQVLQLYEEGVEGTAIWQRLKERGYTGSLSAVYRFLHHVAPAADTATVRVERAPGEEAQVDFGDAGRMIDPATGTLRKTWVFVMTLSWSRYQYVEFVFDQRVPTWLHLHRRAFEFFGGVPQRVVIDNLKAGITAASWDDPQVQMAYRECAEHYGFLIAPCRPRTPEHKGKVEQGGVHYVARNFLGGRTPTTLTQANADGRVWCQTTAGQRVHGTTKVAPLVRFTQTEQAHLQALPPTPYDLSIWKSVRVHRDCYAVFDNAFYSVPFRLIGQKVWVRGGTQDVRLYTTTYDLVATHSRAQQPGERQTQHDHLPPTKLPGLLLARPVCQEKAAIIGTATAAVVHTLLDDPAVDRLPTVGRLLRLEDRYGAGRLEAACARAQRFDEATYPTIKRILEQGLDSPTEGAREVVTAPCSGRREAVREPSAGPVTLPARTFVRSAAELLGHLFGSSAGGAA